MDYILLDILCQGWEFCPHIVLKVEHRTSRFLDESRVRMFVETCESKAS